MAILRTRICAVGLKVTTFPKHFYSLDAMRGIAALTVVFWHWQHFFFRGTELQDFIAAQQPFYFLLEPLYTNGWRAVDLFFCLSGFIFFWLYDRRVSTRETSAKEFAILRFSRLYPLHALTLLVVLVSQQFMLRQYDSHFVYPHNDFYHFALQTVFVSNWGFERGYSFNGPIWSVSVEILCYFVFFLVCFLRLSRWWLLCLLVFGGYYLLGAGHYHVGRGLLSFFMGGLCFKFVSQIALRGVSKSLVFLSGALLCILWILIPLNSRHNTLYEWYRVQPWTADLEFYGKDIIGTILQRMSALSFELILFPATISVFALWEMRRGSLGRRLAFLGHISYSSYLLHFPLQLLVVSLALALSIPAEFFYTPTALFLFFVILILLSFCSYRYFERPCQSMIRRWTLR